MTHVLHMLAALDDIGGTARAQLNLVKRSDSKVLRHTYLTMQIGRLQNDFEKSGAAVQVIGSTSPVTIVSKALQVIKREKPDVISTHCIRSLICGSAVARLSGIPLVHNEHGSATLPPKSVTARLGRLAFSYLVKRTRAILCNSNYTSRILEQHYRISPDLLRTVYLPVERRATNACGSATLSSQAKGFWVGHVGGLVVWRNQSTLIRAIRLLRDRAIDARLVIIGDGPLKSELEMLARQLHLQVSVDFQGYQTNLDEFFDSIDVYANPAYGEAFGIANVEAMLESKPPVLAAAGAHPELIEDSVTGFLCPPGDPEVLAARLETLARDPVLRARMGHACRVRAETLFSSQSYADRYHQAITAARQLASGSRSQAQHA